jgi:hypothetical protein
MDELYKHVDSWDGKRLFIYVVIGLMTIWIFSKMNIGINILIGIIITAFVINYLNHKTIVAANTEKEIMNTKKETIKPKLDESNENEDIVNFLFSIQDMYHYNPGQYIEMVNNIEQFFRLHKRSFIDKKQSSIHYDKMKQNKRDALNALSSLIFTLPEDRRVREKVNNAVVILDDILTKHLDEISFLIDNYLYKNNYDVDTKIIDYGPKALNEYDDIFGKYTYETY